VNDHPADVAGALPRVGADRADDAAAERGLEDRLPPEVVFHLAQRLRQRRDLEVVVDLRLALVGELLQGEDLGGLADMRLLDRDRVVLVGHGAPRLAPGAGT